MKNIGSQYLFFAAVVTMVFHSPLGAQTSAVTADATGLIGKTFTNKLSNTTTLYGDGYTSCTGSTAGGGLMLEIMKKGEKASCDTGDLVLALTKNTYSSTATTTHFLDAVEVTVSDKHDLALVCKGAAAALSIKVKSGPLTKHLLAWKIVNGKFEKLANLKGIRCANEPE